jgi:hypothetical protein
MIKVDKYIKGLKVVRGPDWGWGNQDGGKGCIGEIIERNLSTGWTTVLWSNGYKSGYRIGVEGKYDLALANEADAHLLGHSTSSEPTVESLKAMFPVGTKFIPINETTEYKVYKSWKFDVNSRGDYCFINSNGWYAHNGYLYEKSTGKYAEIVTPTETLALPSSIIASKIPKEGAVYIAHFSDTELEALLKVIVSRIGSHHSDKPRTSEHKHLAWTQNGYWYTINNTSKTLYPRSQFFDEPVEEETPLEKAKRMYPPGTRFKPVDPTGKALFNITYVVEPNWVIDQGSKGSLWFRAKNPYSSQAGYIYAAKGKKWAEIVTECPAPEEPVKQESLKENDIVIFDGPNGPRKYTVNWTCLSFKGGDNDTIFKDLRVDKYQLASKMYGYSIYSGDWPSFNSKDYKAATNLVNELHRLCAEAKSSAHTQNNSKTTISYEQEKHPRDRSISFQPKSVILQGDDIKISRVQAVRASGVRCPAGEIKCRSGHSY